MQNDQDESDEQIKHVEAVGLVLLEPQPDKLDEALQNEERGANEVHQN